MQVRTLPHAVREIYPARFCPPQEGWLPEEIFYDDHRFIRASDPREILIYTGGAILHRRRGGRREYAGGFAFGYRATTFARNGSMTQKGTISGRLENLGPTGRRQPFTQDRADLRAIVAALQFLPWNMDCNRGWRSLVIATASKYVVNNATKGTIPRAWETEGETPHGMELYEFTNEDLWKLMISEIRKLQEDGVQVRFWRTPKGGDYNGGIDRCVRYAQRAALGNEQEEYQIVEAADPWLPPPSPSQPESLTQRYAPLGAPDNIILHDMRHLY
ncbi:hypothetical protein HYALB_00002464 [Hymenoscyphus albidus]|uniref:RNase H type-1 domain-containing protein n=1 Tax=Hymenoscyphus albidus TaxID=595503 RepID=A0A9N9LQA2_9HELO|nr:hypothetical protein HYALB_00002464 [Hymenoscyphus albidus]